MRMGLNRAQSHAGSRQRWFSLGLLFISLLSALREADAEGWPQWFGPRRDGIWRERGLIEKFPKGGPKTVWRVSLGTGYSGPAVSEDRVYVMDRVRGKGANGQPARATRRGIPGTERIVCLRAEDGGTVWKHEYQ